MRNIKGAGAFDFLVVIILTVWIGSCVYNDSSISAERTQVLETYISNTKGTTFENNFLKQFNEKMEDGKISNSEFLSLEENYNGYKLSQLSKSDDSYIKNLELKQAEDKKAEQDSYKIYLTLIVGGIMLFGLYLIFFARGDY